jgi:hypothetical protein
MECDPRIAYHVFMHEDYQDHYDDACLYEVKIIESVGDWNLNPPPCPDLPLRLLQPTYSHTMLKAEPDAWWKADKFAYAYIDLAGCTHVYTHKTVEEVKENIAKHNIGEKYLIFEILHEIKVEYK